jgi:hypothetical protein
MLKRGGIMARSAEKLLEKSQDESRNAKELIVELEENLSRKPTHEQIELRAYELYVLGGCVDGNDVQNWLQAESELLETAQKPAAVTKAAAA